MTVVSFSMAYRSFRGGSGRLHTRLDTPPVINRGHPDSCLARFAAQPALHNALEPKVDQVMEVEVAQKYADRPTLWRTLFARMDRSVLQDARFQPAPDQTDQARITDSMLDKPENPVVTETPEEVLQIRLQHPAYHATGDDLIEGRQGMMSAELRSAAE